MTHQNDDSIPTRQSLLERLKNWDDRGSWQEFFDTYWRLIHNMAVQAGLTEAEAEDVVQETVLSLAKKIGEYKADPSYGSFKSYLLLITRRRIADVFRKRPKGATSSPKSSDETNRTPTAERVPDPESLDWQKVWNEKWQRNLMDVAMDRVKERASPKEWLLFHQQVVKEWPAARVAGQYHVSLTAAYVAKYRISKLIKSEVRKLERESANW